MNSYISTLKELKVGFRGHSLVFLLPAIAFLFYFPLPASAHHGIGGETPNTALEALLSGLGHPLIGLDHLAFVVAAGLLAAAMGRNSTLPLLFVATSALGTVFQVAKINLPLSEFAIAISVLGCGISPRSQSTESNTGICGLGAAVCGLCDLWGGRYVPRHRRYECSLFLRLTVSSTLPACVEQ